MNTTEGNKLIAEFMGGVYYADCSRWGGNIPGYCDSDELQYHTSWDWLMPVFEKIESTKCKRYNRDYVPTITIGRKSCVITVYFDTDFVTLGSSKIEAAWNAIVDFIQWYNDDKNNNRN